MAGSLSDQLLKAGLVDKKKVNKAKQQKHTQRKKNKGKKVAPAKPNAAQQEQLKKQKLSRELNQKANLEKQRQEKEAQVKQLVKDNALDLKKCDQPYYFKMGTKIKQIYVDKAITEKLSKGSLAIVQCNDRFDVVPTKTARQIAQRDETALVSLHEPE